MHVTRDSRRRSWSKRSTPSGRGGGACQGNGNRSSGRNSVLIDASRRCGKRGRRFWYPKHVPPLPEQRRRGIADARVGAWQSVEVDDLVVVRPTESREGVG